MHLAVISLFDTKDIYTIETKLKQLLVSKQSYSKI